MPTATGLRKKLNPALLAGAPYREGDVMGGRYQVKDAVGVGPLGFVLRCADRELGIDVSVKLVHPRFVQTGEEREAFARALDPARRFLHPSLTRLHDVGNDQGWPYFTYTFLDGLPLRRIIDSRLAKGQTFALDEVEPILGQLMSALEAAHPAGAHGDLKAENILVLPDMLKVTDWGVAGGVPRPPFVQAERQKGAHRHLAPEYLAGLALDPRADVYSLGVLVGEMLTGLTPEDEIPELRLVNPDLPDAVEGFYRRALSERPESRFRSVREMFEGFAAVVEGKPALTVSIVPDELIDDGFEVVHFVETQTVVVQPEPAVAAVPPVPEHEAEPIETEPPAAAVPAPPPLSVEVAAPVPPVATPEPPEVTPPPQDAPREGDSWVETPEPAAVTASPAPSAETPVTADERTLWSDADQESEPEPDDTLESDARPLAPVATPAPSVPALSFAAAEPEPAPGAERESAPLRPLPAVPRIAERPALVVPQAPVSVPTHLAGTSPRPVVPSVGMWGPGARRTGAHAAVVVAVSEPAPAVAPPPAVEPAAIRESRAGVRSEPQSPPPVPPPAVARIVAPPIAVAAPVVPPPVAAAAPAESRLAEEPSQAHRGGLWSPGAALAELVSEIQSEEARQLAASDGSAASSAAEAVARAVAEQRPARERLALMSATDEPTAPAPAVSGRPRKVAPAPVPVRARARELQRDLWLKRALLLAVVFAIGMLGAVLLARAH